MKKILIFLFIAIGFITFFGYLANKNDGNNLLKKLDKFDKIDDIYYQSTVNFKFMDLQDSSIIFQQYKRGNNYNAKMISPISKSQTILQVKNGILSFDQLYMIIEGSVQESRADKSVFWLDKIKSNDILPDSIKKLKTPEFLESKKCDMYSAKLQETMNDVDICINKDNVPVYIKYYNLKDFIPLLFDINPVTSVTKNSGDVVVYVSDIILKPAYDASFDLPKEAQYGLRGNVKDIKQEIEKQKLQFKELNKSMKELQSISKDLQNISKEIEKHENDDDEE